MTQTIRFKEAMTKWKYTQTWMKASYGRGEHEASPWTMNLQRMQSFYVLQGLLVRQRQIP